jgi:hypothetical protein
MAPEAHDHAENDGSGEPGERGPHPAVTESDDGSNVVTVDFGRKK